MTLILEILILVILFSVLVILFSPSSLRAAVTGAPFLPTSKSIIRKALKAAGLKPGEKLYDLGFGDGRVLIIAEKEFGAEAIGYEYSKPLFFLSKINLFLNKVKNAKVFREDFLRTDIKKADVIFMFLTPKAFPKLEDKFNRELKRGTRVIVFSSPLLFWTPEKIIPLPERKMEINLYFYIV